MNHFLETHIYFKGKKIGTCDYSILENHSFENTCWFYFVNFSGNNFNIFSTEKPLNVEIFFFNKKNIRCELIELEVFLFEDVEFTNCNDTKCYCKVFSKNTYDIYNQNIINVLWCWNLGEDFDWKLDKVTELEKEALLRSRALYQGLPKKIVVSGDIFIEGGLVRDWYDFYCLLGDTLMGEKGFFALGLDSLEDSLIESYEPARSSENIRLIFCNHLNLVRVLGEKCFQRLIELFEESNFGIELK